MPRKHRPLRIREPKACRACAYAKVRCELQDDSACKRCLRLKRECTMQPPGVHKQLGPKSGDIARLEKKLDTMAAVVAPLPRPLLDASRDVGVLDPILGRSVFADVSDEEAQEMLHQFWTERAPYFPFVVIPMDTTAPKLRQKRPFLFCTIVMVSCLRDANRQLDMARNIREYIGRSIVTGSEKNLDYLQGLLVCLGWYHFQPELGSQSCNTLHLALAMLIDLGLNRRPSSMKGTVPLEDLPTDCKKQNMHRTLEEQRAYLGCFYMSTIVSTCLRDMDPMRYTDYTEHCCDAIEHAAESPNDLYLVRLVRLNRLSDSISRALRDQVDLPGFPSAPLSTILRPLKVYLQHLKPPLPPRTLHESILFLHHHNLEISLYEIALEDNFSTRYGHRPSERANLLFACLTATKAFFDLFSSIALPSYPNLPYPIYAAYSHALGTLSSLLLFDGEGWDLDYVRSIIDFPTVIDPFICRLEEAARTPEHPSNRLPETLARIIPRLRAFGAFHKARRDAFKDDTSKTPCGNAPDTAAENLQDMNFPLPHGLSWRFIRPR